MGLPVVLLKLQLYTVHCTGVQLPTIGMRWAMGHGSSPNGNLQLYSGADADYLDEKGIAPALPGISSCTVVQMLTTCMDEMGMAPVLKGISSCTVVQMLTTWMRWAMGMAPALLNISSLTLVQMLTTWMRWAWLLPSRVSAALQWAASDYLDEMGMAPALLSISS
jgi:hypothetical protein